MEHREIKPCSKLAPFIHCFWELKGAGIDARWDRIFPDGCGGLVINLGSTCITDNGMVKMDFGKTFAVGAATTFKDSWIDADTHLMGICLKPATFSNFYKYASQDELTDKTVELEKVHSFDIARLISDPAGYLNAYYTNRLSVKCDTLQSVIQDIHQHKGLSGIPEIAKRNFTTVRQLERMFKLHVGLTPKQYSNIIRFQNALSAIQHSGPERSLLDIAYDCGYYDHAHLSNDIRKITGLPPSLI